MVRNVLSLDIDVLFECDEYARFMNYDLEPELAWDIVELIKSRGYSISLEPNIEALGKMISILEDKCKGAKVRIIQEHDEIVDIMKEFNCVKSSVYNFDFHQDIAYGNDDTQLNIENWSRHAKKLGLMDKYYWIHREMSDIRVDSPFLFNRDNLLDIDNSLLPEMDLVVICISHHFTPIKYWDIIPNILLEAVRGDLRHFSEVTPTTLSPSLMEGLDDYLIDGTMPDIFRLFRSNDKQMFVAVEKADEGVAMSMISLSGKGNLFKMKEVVDKMLDEYGVVEFNYKDGIRNEVFIKRLVRYYKVIDSRNGYYKIKKQELI